MSDNDDDGLPVTSVGPWTLEKHERLVRYVDITKSVRAKFTRTQSSYIAAQKSLDLWKDPTEAKRQVCANWRHWIDVTGISTQ